MKTTFLSCLLMFMIIGCTTSQGDIPEQSPLDIALSGFKFRDMNKQEIADGRGPPRRLYEVGETYIKGVVLVRSVVILDPNGHPRANIHIAVTDTAKTARGLAKIIAGGANKIGDTADTRQKVGDASYSNSVCKIFSQKNVFAFVITRAEQVSPFEIAKRFCDELKKGKNQLERDANRGR